MYEHIFQLIRSGEAVLFIGSGCSIEAGFPSGAELSKILYDKLTPSEREEIKFTDSLPDMALGFMKLRDKVQLHSVIKEEFSKPPKPSPFHQLLASIPHCKDIFTTNYDCLIEDHLGADNCQVMIEPKDYDTYDKTKRHIFKIHGDVSHLDDIVLTREDYNPIHFDKGSKKHFSVEHLLVTMGLNSVVFIGYSLSDTNIDNILANIKQIMGNRKKEIYLVSPKWKAHDIKHIEEKEITYIDMTGTEFLQKLYEDIEEHVLEELDKGRADTGAAILHHYNMMPKILYDPDNEKVTEIHPVDGKPINIEWDITVDQSELDKFNDYIMDFNPGPTVINKDRLKRFNIIANGLNLFKNIDLQSIEFTQTPDFDGIINLNFESGYSYTGLHVKRFNNMGYISIVFELSILTGVFMLKRNENRLTLDFTFKITEEFPSILDARNEIKALLAVLSGEKFHVKDTPLSFTPQEDIEENWIHLRTYYDMIFEIKQHYGLSFHSFKNLNAENYKAVSLIHSSIKPTLIKRPCEGNFSICTSTDKKVEDGSYSILMLDAKEPKVVELFGHQINIGYQYRFFQNLRLYKSDSSTGVSQFEVSDGFYWTFFSEKIENPNVYAGLLIQNNEPIEGSLNNYIKLLKELLSKDNDGQKPIERLNNLRD